jgi:hypothetical protein
LKLDSVTNITEESFKLLLECQYLETLTLAAANLLPGIPYFPSKLEKLDMSSTNLSEAGALTALINGIHPREEKCTNF